MNKINRRVILTIDLNEFIKKLVSSLEGEKGVEKE